MMSDKEMTQTEQVVHIATAITSILFIMVWCATASLASLASNPRRIFLVMRNTTKIVRGRQKWVMMIFQIRISIQLSLIGVNEIIELEGEVIKNYAAGVFECP